MTNIPNIGKDTIARTVAAALALLNSALVMAGKAPLNLDESGLYEAVSSWPRHRLPFGPGGRITISVRLRGLRNCR